MNITEGLILLSVAEREIKNEKKMDIENFTPGHYEENCGYKYFVPQKINTVWQWNLPEINQLLEKAAIKLGELNSFSKLVPNIDLFIQMHVTKRR